MLSTEGVERMEISGDSYEVVESYPEMNFGHGATFQWFLTEVDTYYPADHLVVIPWDHGSAWKGFCWDDSSGGDCITLQEMEDAIVAAGVYIDILAFDACSCSSIEMLYQSARTGLVELLVASEELVAGDGFPYDNMFTPVALDPSRTPDQVAVDMVDGWIEVYEPLEWGWYCTLGVVDVMEIAERNMHDVRPRMKSQPSKPGPDRYGGASRVSMACPCTIITTATARARSMKTTRREGAD